MDATANLVRLRRLHLADELRQLRRAMSATPASNSPRCRRQEQLLEQLRSEAIGEPRLTQKSFLDRADELERMADEVEVGFGFDWDVMRANERAALLAEAKSLRQAAKTLSR